MPGVISSPMIRGAHVVMFSNNADADRDFLREVLGLRYVDAGHGWLIFALPAAEIGVHPADANDVHEMYLMCDDINVFVSEMQARNVTCSALREERWGHLTRVTLPGGGTLGVYQPTHASPSRVDAS